MPLLDLSADFSKVSVDYRQLWLRILESMVRTYTILPLEDRPTKIIRCEKNVSYTSSVDTYRTRFYIEFETIIDQTNMAPEA
jgi:hypothetical protein